MSVASQIYLLYCLKYLLCPSDYKSKSAHLSCIEGERIMRNITKIRRSVKAISPVISVLLLIAIAVVASLVAYAWVMGYMGNNTSKSGNSINIQNINYKDQQNLIIYVQNTGQSTVHLKQDTSVYVNDVLKNILKHDDIPVDGSLIPVQVGQTVKLEVAYQGFKAGDRIKVVTVEGTFMTASGNNPSGGSNGNGNGNGGSGNGGSTNSPQADFTFSPSSPIITDTVNFYDASTSGSGSITGWLWSFGDGSATSTLQNPTHQYTTANTFTVTLTVTDSNSKTSTVTHTLTVKTTASDYASPIASFIYSPTVPNVGDSVTFSDKSAAGSGTVTQWSWNFGDGSATSTTQNPAHTYSTATTVTVSLTVTNSNGKTGATSQTIVVNPAPTPTPTSPTQTPTSSPNPSSSPTPTPFFIPQPV